MTKPGHRVVNLSENVYNRLDAIRREIASVRGGHPSINDAVLLLLDIYDKYAKIYGDPIASTKPVKPVLEVIPITVDLRDEEVVRRYVEDLKKRLGLG